jgi:hypothetical protein
VASSIDGDLRRINLDRVSQTCPICPNLTGTHIVAAWLSLTRVCFETECPECDWTNATCFDLLKVDEWLRDPTRPDLALYWFSVKMRRESRRREDSSLRAEIFKA